MAALMWLAALLAGVIHVLIFCMESVWWTTPKVRGRFRQSLEQANATKLFAFNQGFYNLFLALGAFGGLALVLMSCLSMLGAAIVLVVSAPQLRRGALIQGAAPLLFLLLAAVEALWRP